MKNDNVHVLLSANGTIKELETMLLTVKCEGKTVPLLAAVLSLNANFLDKLSTQYLKEKSKNSSANDLEDINRLLDSFQKTMSKIIDDVKKDNSKVIEKMKQES